MVHKTEVVECCLGPGWVNGARLAALARAGSGARARSCGSVVVVEALACPESVSDGQSTRFLIDTAAIRNASNPLKSNGETFSNRHGSGPRSTDFSVSSAELLDTPCRVIDDPTKRGLPGQRLVEPGRSVGVPMESASFLAEVPKDPPNRAPFRAEQSVTPCKVISPLPH